MTRPGPSPYPAAQPPPQEIHWPEGTVFTVGHSTLPIDDFIALLKTYGVECLADIRTVPRSRHNPQFNSDALGGALGAATIEYVPMQALGGLRHARKDSPNMGGETKAFAAMRTICRRKNSRTGSNDSSPLSRETRVAIMCAEAVPWRCHRSLVADALNVRGVPVVEILSRSNYREHKLTAFAHVEGSRITYPPEQTRFL